VFLFFVLLPAACHPEAAMRTWVPVFMGALRSAYISICMRAWVPCEGALRN
jgi:hypothetical protein